MIWIDVDTAPIEIPVNIIPLVDAATAKVVDEGVVYNEAGLDLVWHFTTTAGMTSATSVTPTNGGDYNWQHQDAGMYTIAMPAAEGASANNDATGFGYFTGNSTANLPWRGPTIGFRVERMNAAMVNGAFIDANNRVDVGALAGTAQRATDLALVVQYLFANAVDLTNDSVVKDDSVIAQMLTIDGNISDYDDTTKSQEAIAVAIANKTGYSLAASGLDAIPMTPPNGLATNFREMVVATWRRLYKKVTMNATTLTDFKDDDSTPNTTQALSDSAGTQTQGKAS